MPLTVRPPLPDNSKQIKLILSELFLVSGSATVLIGQLLPMLAKQYELNDLQLGLYFPSQFAGSFLGTFLTGRFARKNKFISASFIGALLMSSGVLLLNVNSISVSYAAFLINGVGIGLTLPAINLTVLELSPENTASSLSFLNFFWGVGAIICKPFVDLTSRGPDIVITTTVLAAPLLIGAGMLYLQPTRIIALIGSSSNENSVSKIPIWTLPLAWAIALFNFIHVGFESGMGGWLTTYTERLEDTHVVHWLSPTLFYFVCFVLGRGVAPALFRFLSENKMLLLGLFTILGGMIITVSSSTVTVLGIGAAVAGFGTSWIFPTSVSRFSRIFGASANRRATPLFICGTLGAASSTWLIGFVSNKTGDLRSGMYILVASIVLLILLQLWLSVRTPVIAKTNASK